MTLSTFQKKLDNLGFETVISDNVLQAARENGANLAIEITVDSGGEVKVVKKKRSNKKTRPWKFKGTNVPIVCENLSTETFRVLVDSPDDFDLLEKEISEE